MTPMQWLLLLVLLTLLYVFLGGGMEHFYMWLFDLPAPEGTP